MIVKLTDYLFIGDQQSSQLVDFLVDNRVSRIINCAGNEIQNAWEVEGMRYLTFFWKDKSSFNLFDGHERAVVNQIVKFVNGVKSEGESVLIQSVKGTGRSAICAACYFIGMFGWGYKKTFQFLVKRKPDIKPHREFLRQIITVDNLVNNFKNNDSDSPSAKIQKANYEEWNHSYDMQKDEIKSYFECKNMKEQHIREEEELLVHYYLNSTTSVSNPIQSKSNIIQIKPKKRKVQFQTKEEIISDYFKSNSVQSAERKSILKSSPNHVSKDKKLNVNIHKTKPRESKYVGRNPKKSNIGSKEETNKSKITDIQSLMSSYFDKKKLQYELRRAVTNEIRNWNFGNTPAFIGSCPESSPRLQRKNILKYFNKQLENSDNLWCASAAAKTKQNLGTYDDRIDSSLEDSKVEDQVEEKLKRCTDSLNKMEVSDYQNETDLGSPDEQQQHNRKLSLTISPQPCDDIQELKKMNHKGLLSNASPSSKYLKKSHSSLDEGWQNKGQNSLDTQQKRCSAKANLPPKSPHSAPTTYNKIYSSATLAGYFGSSFARCQDFHQCVPHSVKLISSQCRSEGTLQHSKGH